MTTSKTRTSGLERAAQVFDCLLRKGEPCSAYELARSAGAPLSTIYNVVESLADLGLLERRDGGAVWFGVRLYHYGLAYGRTSSALEVARAEMRALSTLLNETVQICGRDDGHMVVLDMAEATREFRVASRVGMRVPLNWTASGRLLAGHLPYLERYSLFERSARPSPTNRAVVNPGELCRLAEAALAGRLSIQLSESDEAVACIAGPVLDPKGACELAISIVLPEQRARERQQTYAAAVRDAASLIESRLSFTRLPQG